MTKSNQQARLKQARTDQTFDAMRNYVEQHERDAPKAFVGRDGILSDLMSAVETMATTGYANAPPAQRKWAG